MSIDEKLARQDDEAVRQVGFVDVLAEVAFARLVGRSDWATLLAMMKPGVPVRVRRPRKC